ncbi:MAG: PDR/VanB family oxidoreductase [Rhodovibrionaceae bacterium]
MADNKTLAEITAVKSETPEIKVFVLEPRDRSLLAKIEPGAHIDISVGGHLRQYSLCNGPEDREFFLIAVKKEPESRGGSRAMHETLSVGDWLEIGPPRNNFRLALGAQASFLLAGGIGITPLLSMARHLQCRGAPYRLLYFARSREQAAFFEELSSEKMREKAAILLGLDAAATRGHLAEVLRRPAEGTHVYACGPQPFLEAVRAQTDGRWPSAQVHFEYFQAQEKSADPGDRTFKVKLASSGEIFEIPPGKTIAKVLAENGIAVEVSCEQGICGTCLTGVLQGLPDHRDELLDDDVDDLMALCVSRAKSDLIVIDL